MPLLSTYARALALSTLLIIPSTAAQTCYYPDGSESNHVACRSSGSEASCCDASQVCMDNGLCFGDGIMSRGSCTDKNWNSQECSQFCYEVSRNTSIPVTACTNDGESSEFMCGQNATNCRKSSALFTLPSASITLRTSELDALIKPAVSSALAAQATPTTPTTQITITATPTSNPDAIYTPGQMAGLGVGLGVPFLIATILALLLWRRDRARTPKLMYPLPDNMADPYTTLDGRPLFAGAPSAAGSLRPPVSRDGSILSLNTLAGNGTPAHLQTFAERYQVMKGASGGFQLQRVELDASPIPGLASGKGDFVVEDEHELHDLKVPLPKEF